MTRGPREARALPQVEASRLLPVLEAKALEKRFGGIEAVRGLSLAVLPGELYGLVGPDGAGKSTTIRILTGLMTASAGEALVLGQGANKGAGVREAIGYMPQQYSLYGDLSVHENLRFFGRLFGLSRVEFADREARLLHITRLERFVARRADALSGGMYKKLALACALLHRPRVLVLDEPTNGVDPVSRRELWDLLYELVGEGMAVLLATPYMDEAARCHRVGLLNEGRLLTEGAPGELAARFEHRAFLLRSPARQELEEAISTREELLAVTPHGDALRAVVRRAAAEGFSSWAAGSPLVSGHEEVRPDFEDLFLGLVAEERLGHGPGPAPASAARQGEA
ncbi:MAG: ABC transporter ATP-binding protein [Polyangia bacterium]|jgi:ABC-2 type transport system ATP-binding protein|nr:ABC transporter ATP-binding protein [Polyangia bacterium]